MVWESSPPETARMQPEINGKSSGLWATLEELLFPAAQGKEQGETTPEGPARRKPPSRGQKGAAERVAKAKARESDGASSLEPHDGIDQA